MTFYCAESSSMIDCSSPSVQFVTPRMAKRLATDPHVLALIRFATSRSAGDGDSPWLDTGLPVLGADPAPVQCWRTAAAVRHFRVGRFSVHAAPGLALVATMATDRGNPGAAAEDLYTGLIATAKKLNCPHVLRIWQYLPRITAPLGEEDRYRAYCAGRRRALLRLGLHRDATLPAASLLGDRNEAILLYALVSTRPGTQVENPRQVSAFRYPPQYGRASPSFSRALAMQWPDGRRQLYISGTASVVGHATLHHTVLAQTRETLVNLEALIAADAAHNSSNARGLATIDPLKVYLRHSADYSIVRKELDTRLPPDHPILYLQADVCRPDLLVEIEGIANGR
jgi:chorismate lyase/3-hydroxybenzoate synthase